MNSLKDRKIRLVFMMNSFILGGEKKLVNFFKFLPSTQYELHLVTLSRAEEHLEIYDLLPAHVKVSKFDFNGFKDVQSWWRLFRRLREIQPDIVVSGLFFSNTAARILKPFIGYKSIAMELNTYTDKTGLQKFVDWALSHVSFKIVAVSQGVATFTSAQEHIPLRKFVVIHNGLNFDEIDTARSSFPPKEQLKKELGFSPKDKLVLSVGRLATQKNHTLLLEAFTLFSKSHPEFKLVILGDGGMREELEQRVADLGLGNYVLFLGAKKDIFKYYAASEFLVSVSKIEGMSNAYLEAFAFGIPVVATKTAGTDELIEDGKNGFFVDFDAQNIAQTMERVAREGSSELGTNARKTAERFNIRSTMKSFEKLFYEAMGVEN